MIFAPVCQEVLQKNKWGNLENMKGISWHCVWLKTSRTLVMLEESYALPCTYQDRVEYAWGHPEFTRKYALRGDDKMVAHTQPVLFVVPNFLILGLGYTLEQNSSFSPKMQYWWKGK